MRPSGVLETCLYVDDLPAAERFYAEVLGLELISSEPGRHVFFQCGAGVVLLFNPERTATESSNVKGAPIPMHGARGQGHLAFRVDADELPSWKDHLQRAGVAIESEVDWPGGGSSIYFRDPAGNSIELAPPGIWGLSHD